MSENANQNVNPFPFQSELEKKGNFFKNSITLKMFIVGFLILILFIPLAFVQSLIKEREMTKNKAVQEINESWGENIKLYGPILKIPYYTYTESTQTDIKTGKVTAIQNKETNYAYFFPDQLNVEGTISAESKKRGIYETSVYIAETNISGNFPFPDFDIWEIKDENVLWEKSQIIFQTSNVKGINNQLTIKLNESTLNFSSEFKNAKEDNLIVDPKKNSSKIYQISTNPFDLKQISKLDTALYQMHFSAKGSESFEIIPIGKETKMHLSSKWKDANFFGSYLPFNSDKLKKEGFDAHWKILEMNRPFEQQYDYLPNLNEFSFGVNFMIAVDDYQQNERSSKYGYLVISLTFLLFFLIQTLSKINIHPFQYLMLGLALVIFYTLLLSISEHSNFSMAYLIAGLSTIILIGLFSKAIMKTWKFPFFISLSLLALYAFIYIIIQMENYALLVGSIGLFVILSAVMYVSRKIEWS